MPKFCTKLFLSKQTKTSTKTVTVANDVTSYTLCARNITNSKILLLMVERLILKINALWPLG